MIICQTRFGVRTTRLILMFKVSKSIVHSAPMIAESNQGPPRSVFRGRQGSFLKIAFFASSHQAPPPACPPPVLGLGIQPLTSTHPASISSRLFAARVHVTLFYVGIVSRRGLSLGGSISPFGSGPCEVCLTADMLTIRDR